MARRFIKFNKRVEKKVTKKEIIENFNNTWKKFFKSLNNNNNTDKIIFPACAFENYFKEENIIFEKNKIHIIQGNNGQGKTSFLKNLANSTMYDSLIQISTLGDLGKRGSNTLNVNKILNEHQYSFFKFFDENDEKKINFKKLANINNNFSLYIDFSLEFFQKDERIFLDKEDLINKINLPSNGEMKIKSINSFFLILKTLVLLKKENLQNNFDICIFLDEPDNGLSKDIQIEFHKRLKYYLKRMPENVSLTFFIVSHSFYWKKDNFIKIYNILDFKKENQKKLHTKIFV